MTEMTLSAREGILDGVTPQGAAHDRAALNGSQPHDPVHAGGTDPRLTDDGKVPCDNGCGNLRRAGNKSGLCRECFYRSDWPLRNAMSKRGEGAPRKREIEWRVSYLTSLLRALARQAGEEDVGRGLAGLLELHELTGRLVDEVGVAKVAEIGPELVSQELGWSLRTRANNRWGLGSPAYRKIRGET